MTEIMKADMGEVISSYKLEPTLRRNCSIERFPKSIVEYKGMFPFFPLLPSGFFFLIPYNLKF